MGDDNREYQLRFAVSGAPFAFVGVCCDEYEVIGADYLPKGNKELPPQNYLAKEVAKQLRAYFRNRRGHRFDIPLRRAATKHQQKVREVVREVSFGECITYGAIAKKIGSCAQAVGGACGKNAIVLIIPCHRVIAADGIGGFGGGDNTISAKQWLLNHENSRRSCGGRNP